MEMLGKEARAMDWTFLLILVVMVPIVFLPPAFLMLRPRATGHRRQSLDEE
jgi:hypothetical protein